VNSPVRGQRARIGVRFAQSGKETLTNETGTSRALGLMIGKRLL
jgi:hypothetical protein